MSFRPLPTAHERPGPLRILIAEDNADARELLGELLETWGHRVATARDGHAAVHIARQTPPDLALVDLDLPGLDGHEVARQLRILEQNAKPVRRTYLVSLSGHDFPYDRALADFDEHRVKPIELASLRELIDSLAERVDRAR